MIALISIDPSFGNCVGIYKSLLLYDEVTAIFRQKDPKGFHKHIPHMIGYENIPKADQYIIVSSHAYTEVKDKVSGDVRVIVTDSFFMKNDVDLSGVMVYCMPDLIHYCGYPYKPYYPPFEYPGPIIKNSIITVAHSPYSKGKASRKGTKHIIEAVKRLGVNMDLIVGVSWEESIKRKSKAHIFIDQIPDHYIGGLGKSGVEAMAVGCLTMTSGVEDDCPVIRVTKDTLYDTLLLYITHPMQRDVMSYRQTMWVEKYLNYEYQGRYLTE